MDQSFSSASVPEPWGAQSTVGVVSLASCVEASALQAGCDALRTLSGWQVETSPVALQREGDFAGSPAARAAALMEMWRRDDVDAIVCARGGYGSNYLLPLLDFEAMAATPKVFVGYSDNTSLLLALDRAGIVSFHGPMVASDFANGQCGRGFISRRARRRCAGSSVSQPIRMCNRWVRERRAARSSEAVFRWW